MGKQEAINKLKLLPKAIEYCNKWGGSLLFDKIKGGIYFCNEDEKTWYEHWDEKEGTFRLFQWQFGGLDHLELEVIYTDEQGFC